MDHAELTTKASSAARAAKTSALRALKASNLFARKQLWIWPIVAGVILGTIGWFLRQAVEDSIRQEQGEELQAILNANVAALKIWMAEQAADTELFGEDEALLPFIYALSVIEQQSGSVERSLLLSPAQTELRNRLGPRLKKYHFEGFVIVSPTFRVLACNDDAFVGRQLSGAREEFFRRVLTSGPAVSLPYRSSLMLTDESGELKANLPTMFAAAPIKDAKGEIVAALGLRIRPDMDFTRILQVAQVGASGETYAFDKNGLLLSQSRFDNGLKELGLLVNQPDSRSVLTLELRDPGVDMTLGHRPKTSRSEQPLTRMAESATKGESGIDVQGYRDYRGVPVIGAWTWLEDLGFGVTAEQDLAEAFQPLYFLRTAFWSMFALLALASLGIFVSTVFVARANRDAQRAALEAKQLGQYKLEEKLGEGGMGVVYRGKHAMLHRPTAVKFLASEKSNVTTLARFEREVQLTSQLNHPNTIAIYDYGRTPEGIFYYAMEYLEGIDLERLVRDFGPQNEGRVISILRQACGSLAEAHCIGLIHRDIKPANLMLTDRGGISDFVKVLDFGLVKALDSRKDSSLTAVGSFTGTPLYMSPESIEEPDRVDARSDLYALGAVGYYLVTGTPVFDGKSVVDVLRKHVEEDAEAPSRRLGRAVSREFEAVLLKALSKNPKDRFQTAEEMSDALAACPMAAAWTTVESRAWWARFRPATPADVTRTANTESQGIAATQILDTA